MEFGIFSDEGLIEGQFATAASAEKAIAERYSPEDELHVAEVCPYHEGQERLHCEECDEEDNEEEEENEEDE